MDQSERIVNFAVIGLGVGQSHIGGILKVPGARLAAICDLSEERLASAAAKYGVPTFTDYQVMLKNPEIDVVCVCTPSGTHADMGIACAEAGKNVLAEKPLDISLEKADALISACQRAGVKLGAVFQRRLEPLSKVVRAAIQRGELGKVLYGDALLFWYRADSYYAGGYPAAWRGTWAMDGGGSFMNQGIHSIDLLQWFIGPVKSVYAKGGTFNHSIEAEDLGTAMLTFENGALGNIMCTTCAYPGLSNDFHIIGEKGTIVTRDDRLVSWRVRGGSQEEEVMAEKEMLSKYGGPRNTGVSADPTQVTGHPAHIADMVAAVREGRDPMITGAEARKALALGIAIREAISTGREVMVQK